MKQAKLYKILAAIGIAASISGCDLPGGLPARKHMPLPGTSTLTSNQFSDRDFLNPLDGLPFIDGESGISDIPANFVLVPMPDASADSSMISLVNLYKPLAVPMLTSWAQSGKGVAIDLSSHNSETFKTEFDIEQPGSFKVPIIVIWDKNSVSRLRQIETIAGDMPDFRLNYASGNSPQDQAKLFDAGMQ